MIPDSIIEEIRNRTDVVAVIGRHVDLQKSGRTWKGCCPFHGEKTPSFHVYPEDKHFKCYGCDEYGDVFKFLQKLEGKEFPEVVRALAAEVGVEIPEETVEDSAEARRRRKERAEAVAACDAAARYWQARLWSAHGESGRAYLASRGVSEEEARRFRLGIAAPEWSDLPPRLAQKEISLPSIERAGLRVPSDRGGYDRFRGRLMFPIAALDGQTIGFGARAMGDEKGAKYINTPETVLYKKSRVLYGLDLARESIRKTRSAVLVEGYFDVIGLHQAGVKNAVAVCGTALTPEHLELLERCDCREVVILFDGDLAGLAAPAKAAQVLLPSSVSGKVAVLPSDAGKIDPDDFARARGKEGVEALLASAVPLTDFLIGRAVDRHCAGNAADAPVEAKLAAVRELAPLVRLAPEGLSRTTFEERIARRMELDLQALRDEILGRPRAAPPGADRRPRPPAGPRATLLLPGPAVDALGILVGHPDLAPVAAEEDLARLFPEGPLAELVRDLCREAVPLDAVLARLEPAADARVGQRVKALAGPAAPHAADAEREFRRAVIEAKIDGVRRELSRLEALVARSGAAGADDSTREYLTLQRRRLDLEKRREELRRS
jgi:DNA primase